MHRSGCTFSATSLASDDLARYLTCGKLPKERQSTTVAQPIIYHMRIGSSLAEQSWAPPPRHLASVENCSPIPCLQSSTACSFLAPACPGSALITTKIHRLEHWRSVTFPCLRCPQISLLTLGLVLRQRTALLSQLGLWAVNAMSLCDVNCDRQPGATTAVADLGMPPRCLKAFIFDQSTAKALT